MRIPPFVLLLFTVVGWASAFPAIRVALPAFGPIPLALTRFFVSSLALLLVALKFRPPALQRRDAPSIALMGLLGFALYALGLNIGEETVNAGTAAFIVQTAPLWSTLLAVFFLKERVSPRGWLGVFVALCGVLLLARGATQTQNTRIDPKGVALIFGASLSISSYVIFQKRLIPRYGALGTTAYAQWAGLLWLLPLLFAPGVWPKIQSATPAQWWPVIWLGLVPSALSYVLWGALVGQFPVSRAVSFLYFVPVCASLMGWAFLGEAMSPLALLGGAVAIGGVAIVNAGRPQETRSSASTSTLTPGE